MNEPMITAHSGCEGTERDSMESIDKALELGAEAIEVDVRVDQAGTLRISHNAVSQEEYLEKPTLSEVLYRIKGTGLAVNFDLKEQQTLYKVLDETAGRGFPRERLIFSGCTSPEQLARDPLLTEKAQFFLNLEEVLKFVYLHFSPDFEFSRFTELMTESWKVVGKDGNEIPEKAADAAVLLYGQLRASAANLPKGMVGSMMTEKLKQAGVPLSVWTVDEADCVRQCLEYGVHNITARSVEQAMAIRKSWAKGQ